MNRLAGSVNGSSSTRIRGSACPCGETIGRSRTPSYSRRAMVRTSASAGGSRSAYTVRVAMGRGSRRDGTSTSGLHSVAAATTATNGNSWPPSTGGGNHRRKSAEAPNVRWATPTADQTEGETNAIENGAIRPGGARGGHGHGGARGLRRGRLERQRWGRHQRRRQGP